MRPMDKKNSYDFRPIDYIDVLRTNPSPNPKLQEILKLQCQDLAQIIQQRDLKVILLKRLKEKKILKNN